MSKHKAIKPRVCSHCREELDLCLECYELYCANPQCWSDENLDCRCKEQQNEHYEDAQIDPYDYLEDT